MKYAFLEEEQTRRALGEFIATAPRLSMDRKCAEFETSFAQFQGRGHAVLFNSGGSANLALLQALKNLGRLAGGDRVGFSCLTWSTNTMPIIQLGMIPVAIDVDPATLNVMSSHLRDRLRETSLRALFITNALGLTGDLPEIRRICDERGIILVEDNCESLGSELPQGKAGNFGIGSTFSFYVAHHMSTIEGGMVCTDDAELSEMLRIVRANGWDRNLTPAQQSSWRERHGIRSEFEAKYAFYDLGYNLRPTEITGFLGLTQLAHLPRTIEMRVANFARIAKAVAANDDFIPLRHDHISRLSSFAFPFVCRTRELRDRYASRFSDAGIEIRPIIAGNMQRQPFYAKYVNEHYAVPGSDFLHECGFYSGNYPELDESDLLTIERCLAR
jgi:CDP-6-deoxy-D-xylo-4-hexulose-3-dehydrase